MFLQTYGLLYQQNANIFTTLFDDLRGYYKGQSANLNEVMDSFFSKLLQRMFELLNRNHEFNSVYLNCVSERMNDLKPFGEVPMKLSTQVRRAFIAARTFVQGLAVGRDVINTVMEVPNVRNSGTAELLRALTSTRCSSRRTGYVPAERQHLHHALRPRGYYKGQSANLNEVMDSFFSKLLQRMFELLNRNHEFNSVYLNCVSERMNDLKPFGEVPMKLSTQVRRAFIAARTFVQGLAVGRDVINTVMEIPPSEACLKAFVRMTYCPHCRGLTSTKPCNNYCLNTMKGCLAHQADLNAPWNEFIGHGYVRLHGESELTNEM
ncbi:Glypican-6 [Bulinus truncatus]|nr:Glypican-6 [Bulinus truncatus]